MALTHVDVDKEGTTGSFYPSAQTRMDLALFLFAIRFFEATDDLTSVSI